MIGFVCSGALGAAGLVLLVAWWRRTWPRPNPAGPGRAARTWRRWWTGTPAGLPDPSVVRIRRMQVGVAAVAFTGAWLVTAVPVTALAAALAAFAVPGLWRATASGDRAIARLDALAQWTAQLAELRRTGAGLTRTLTASAATAPDAIRPQVHALAARLAARAPLEAALRGFADDLADPTADTVAAALLVAATGTGTAGLSPALAQIATSVADQVRMRREIDAKRSEHRSSMRLMVVILLAAAVGEVLVHASVYRSPTGVAVLVVVGVMVTSAVTWMRSLATPDRLPRLLTADASASARTANPSPATDRAEGATR